MEPQGPDFIGALFQKTWYIVNMTFSKDNNSYILRLFKGEKIIETLLSFCKSEAISAGSISAIGGASDITLGYFSLETHEYAWKDFPEVHEIVSLTGNVSLVDGEPFIHAHIVISNKEFQAFGGHLKEATVAATLEVVISPNEINLSREMDAEIGLKLLKFSR